MQSLMVKLNSWESEIQQWGKFWKGNVGAPQQLIPEKNWFYCLPACPPMQKCAKKTSLWERYGSVHSITYSACVQITLSVTHPNTSFFARIAIPENFWIGKFGNSGELWKNLLSRSSILGNLWTVVNGHQSWPEWRETTTCWAQLF